MNDTRFAAFAADGAADGTGCFGDFSYGAGDTGAMRLTLSIFADRGHLRDELREDAMEAGFRVAADCGLDGLLADDEVPLGDVIMVDCPMVDAAMMAALSRLDMRAARSGAALVVSTTLDGLDDVFCCLDQSQPQILVAPSRAERAIALGQALGHRPGRVSELTDADRLMLMRLSEQVNAIGARLERLDGTGTVEAAKAPGAVGETAFSFRGLPVERAGATVVIAPELPKARLVRSVLRQRQMRARFFPGNFFSDPAWDMLLDLTAARAEQTRVSVTSLCIASNVPSTTALRWISLMTEAGLLRREDDVADRRRAFIALTDKAADAMARFFAALGHEPAPLL